MKVTYIGHSGFAVELSGAVLLFDYYRGALPQWREDKPLFVFVSHGHRDHFNWEILKRYGQRPNVRFFFGNDIRLGEMWLAQRGIGAGVREKICRLAGGRSVRETLGDAQVAVRTLKSTDTGVAFVAEVEGKRIYHAGDLNWWHWESEDRAEDAENEAMGRAYREQIDQLAGMHFDVSFVPLDPRLKDSFDLGLNYFLEKTDSPAVFPMHMWGQYEAVKEYKARPQNAPFAGRVVEIETEGQTWNI